MSLSDVAAEYPELDALAWATPQADVNRQALRALTEIDRLRRRQDDMAARYTEMADELHTLKSGPVEQLVQAATRWVFRNRLRPQAEADALLEAVVQATAAVGWHREGGDAQAPPGT